MSITPATGVANWILEGAATAAGRINEFSWGGELTTSTAMATRIARDSAVGTGTRTAGLVHKINQLSPANGVFFSTTYATTQPTIADAGALFGTSWNAHGGVIRWLAAPGEEFIIHFSGAANLSIECRANVGTGTSSYSTIWEED